MPSIDFPFHIDHTGRTATADPAKHVRDLIEQLLFTSPRERVNRPAFGSGIDHAVFKPNHDILAETTRITAEAAIQQHLGHLIHLVALNIEAIDNRLAVEIAFTLRNEQEVRTTTIQHDV